MRHLAFVIMALLPTLAVAEMISVSVPSAVSEAVDFYRDECTDEGGELELDGDEISKLWTDQGEAASEALSWVRKLSVSGLPVANKRPSTFAPKSIRIFSATTSPLTTAVEPSATSTAAIVPFK